MPKKVKKKGKKKKVKKQIKKEVKKDDIIKIPQGNDWIILSFCLVPWEATHITMFLNFEVVVRSSVTIASLKRLVENKIGTTNKLKFYLNPPKKEEALLIEDCLHFRLIDMDFKGSSYNNPQRCLLFFDFSPSYPILNNSIDLGIDPLLLAEPSQILLKHSENIKQEIDQLLKTIIVNKKKKINK